MSLTPFTCFDDANERQMPIERGTCLIELSAITAIGPLLDNGLRIVTVHGGAAYLLSDAELQRKVSAVLEMAHG